MVQTSAPVTLLKVVTDDTIDAALFSPESICIVVEDEILVSCPTNLADSFLLCTRPTVPKESQAYIHIYSKSCDVS